MMNDAAKIDDKVLEAERALKDGVADAKRDVKNTLEDAKAAAHKAKNNVEAEIDKL